MIFRKRINIHLRIAEPNLLCWLGLHDWCNYPDERLKECGRPFCHKVVKFNQERII